MKKYIKKFIWLIAENLGLGEIKRDLRFNRELFCDDYLQKYLYNNEKYANSKKLNRYEYKIYSQGGEDGIIDEIFKRIGTTNKFFIEFGAGTGLENNTIYLLLKNWKGCWIDGDSKKVETLNKIYGFLVRQKKLRIGNVFVTAENAEDLFNELNIPKEPDLLSIDIDGNDYWVWKAIKNYKPRAVIIEYNALWRPDLEWVMKYNPKNEWNRNSYFGAGLKSLELLGAQKGYKLVGCSFAGINAFFVREDLVKDKFLTPFIAENHYEPKRIFLLRQSGDKRFFGEFENI